MVLTPGMRVGHYEIKAIIGSGGMGDVYRARDAKLEREVALKTLRSDVASDPVCLARFTREARAAAALSHPAIVTVHSVEHAAPVHFLTMELIEGQPLSAVIPRDGMPLAFLLQVALPIAEAVAAAHDHGVAHRDLKPANVMVDRAQRVKVLDFGLAKELAPFSADATMTATHLVTERGLIVGTVPYMAPEQIEGRGADHRVDVFSFGVMLYEMAAGVRPFRGDSPPALMSAILRDAPAPLTGVRPDLPEQLGRIVERCLRKLPVDRYATMRDVAVDLRNLQRALESGSVLPSAAGSGVTYAARQGLRIAVLPLKVSGSDRDIEDFAEGIAEDVTSGLSRFPALSVVARQSTLRLKGQGPDLQKAADQLGARYVIDGAVRRSGSTIRVGVQLVEAQSGAQMWAETYTRSLDGSDIFAVQDDVTDRIVATVGDVHGVLARSMVQVVREQPLDVLTLAELLLRFWAYHQQPRVEEHAGLRRAFEAFASRMPACAEPWWALAHLYAHEHGHFFNPQPDPLGRARHAANRAVELHAASDDAWEALAVACYFARDTEGFRVATERALALNPRNTNTGGWAALLLGNMGDYDRALQIIDRMMALNPHHPGWYYFVHFNGYYFRGNFLEAYRAVKKINMPDLVWSHFVLACACGQLGRAEESHESVRRLRTLVPPFADDAALYEAVWRWFPYEPHVIAMFDGYRKAVALSAQCSGG
jgi:eukaryotic-like serine/threonine-protein kinase